MLATVFITKIGNIEIDASLSEDHIFETDVSRNPVENGTVYADHVVLLPVILHMEGRISDTSLRYLGFNTAGRAINVYKALVDLQVRKEPIDVHTGLNTYKNMFLESLSVPRTSADGHSIRFSAILSELLVTGDNINTNRENIAKDVRHSALSVDNIGFLQKILI